MAPRGTVNNGTFVSRATKVGAVGVAGAATAAAAYVGYKALTGIPDASSNSKYMGNFRFPLDLINSEIDRNFYIDIKFQEYQRRSIFNSPFLKAKGGIQLPIPAQLRDVTSVNWNKANGEGLVGAGIEQFLNEKNNITSLGGGQGSSLADRLSNLNTSIGNVFTAGAAGAAAKGLAAAGGAATPQALQLAGLAMNPFLTMLFTGPEFKEHTFTWDLAPRNAKESETLMKIINAFKSNMLPAMQPGTGGIFLKYPNIANITLYPDEDFLYKFKPCAVKSLSVNFNGGGTPSFFKGTNAPTMVNLTVSFTEIEYWLKEDIEDPSGNMRSQGAIGGGATSQNTPVVTRSNTGRAAGPV